MLGKSVQISKLIMSLKIKASILVSKKLEFSLPSNFLRANILDSITLLKRTSTFFKRGTHGSLHLS